MKSVLPSLTVASIMPWALDSPLLIPAKSPAHFGPAENLPGGCRREKERKLRGTEMRGGERFLCNKRTIWSRYKILRPRSLMEIESCLGVDNGHECVYCWEMDKLGCL